MQASLQRRFAVSLGVLFAVGLGASGYILGKFRSYEASASKVMSGEHQAVLLGHLIEARVRAAEETVQASVSTQEANEAFKERVLALAAEIKGLSKEHSSKPLDEAQQTLASLAASKAESTEDLFVHYRNIKTSAFNIYRLAWANKWMTVAKTMGMIINDLDNLPYHSGEKAAGSVYSKIAQLTAVITNASIPQSEKLMLFGQLGGLKQQISRYNEASQSSEKMRSQRVSSLKAALAGLKKHNDSQGKSMMQFSDVARAEVFKGVIALLLFALFGLIWFMACASSNAKRLIAATATITKQMAGWVSAGGNLTTQGFQSPGAPVAEFAEAYQILDQVMRRVNLLRREDILVKRLLNVPVMMVNDTRQSIFWNSAYSILCKTRTLEEQGPTLAHSILRLVDPQNKPLNPLERAFEERKEIAQLGLLRVGEDRIAVQVICTPVLAATKEVEYVMVHVRDLRDENRRLEAELESQLSQVQAAIKQVKEGGTPPEAPVGARRPVVETIKAIKAHALELQQQAATTASQLETMRERMSREASLKKSVHGRMEQIKTEISSTRAELAGLRALSDDVAGHLSQLATRDKLLRTEYVALRKRAQEMLSDLRLNQDLVNSCMRRLEEATEFSERVRANEKMIHSILEKSTVLNANNSILGSKRDLTPTDVVTITENIGQLMGQFQRTYSFMVQSVNEIDKGTHDLRAKLHDKLVACAKLVSEEQAILKAINQSERVMEADADEARELNRELQAIKAASQRISAQLQSVESKAQRLVQIGQASLDLQQHLEHGFQGMFRRVAGPEVSS